MKIKLTITLIITLLFFYILYAQQNEALEILKNSLSQFENLDDYTLTMDAFYKKGDKVEKKIYGYKFKKPNLIFYSVIEGENKGATVAFPYEGNKVRAHKGGMLSVVKLSFEPTDKKVTSIRGDRVDQSDFGSLLKKFIQLQGEFRLTSEQLEGKDCYLIEVKITEPKSNDSVSLEKLWIDKSNNLPYRHEKYEGNELVYKKLYKEVKINVGLSKEKDFSILK